MALPSKSQKSPTQSKTESTATSKPNHSTDPVFDEILSQFSDSIAWFFSRPAALYKWLTAPKGGNRIFLSAIAVYSGQCQQRHTGKRSESVRTLRKPASLTRLTPKLIPHLFLSRSLPTLAVWEISTSL